jgi:biopolymer transport protein ExbD
MVDLGFLLITFFVFTTTMATPTAMKVEMPYDRSVPADPICNSCVLTTVLSKNGVIRYYEGAIDTARVQTTDFNGIRQIIQQKKIMVQQARGSADQFVLIIKPSAESSFKNFVDITDEVTINNIQRYYLDELTGREVKLIIE